jgi:hypothetical protein
MVGYSKQPRTAASQNDYVFKHRGIGVAHCRLQVSQSHQKWVWSVHFWLELKGKTEPLQTGGHAATLKEAFEDFCDTFERIKAMPGFDIKRVRAPLRNQFTAN